MAAPGVQGDWQTMIDAALVGLGWWGRTLQRELAGSKLLRPVLGIDPSAAARAAVCGIATAARFEDALARDDIAAVIICSPHALHASQIIAAAAAGKHVFCEKPLCSSARQMQAIAEAVTAAGVQLGIGHERRFEPGIIELRARAAAGEFGTPLLLEGNFSQDKFLSLAADNWRLSAAAAPVGPLSATGIHLVDLAIAFLGRPAEVWARLATRGSTFANGDTLAIMIAFASGASALITAILATPFVGRLALYGSRAWAELRDRTHPEQPSGWDLTTAARGTDPVTRYLPPHHAVRDNLESFARAVAGEERYPVDLAEMAANVHTYEAIIRSVRSGRITRIAA
jgi:predicted dehydrogenase